MAGLAKITKALKAVNKRKKHGVKAGQKSLVRPSQKKSVKNGRHQEKETPKKKDVKKAVAAIPAGLDGNILDDDLDFTEELPPAPEIDDEYTDDHLDEYDDLSDDTKPVVGEDE